MKIEKIKWESAKTYKNIQDAIDGAKDIQFFWYEPKPGKIDGDKFATKLKPENMYGKGKPTIPQSVEILEMRLLKEKGGVRIVKEKDAYKAVEFTIGNEGEEVTEKTESRILNGKKQPITVYYDQKAQPVAWTIKNGGNNE